MTRLALALVWGALAVAWGQDAGVLTLDALLEGLDGRHPQIAAGLAQQRAAQGQRLEAAGAYDTQLGAELSLTPLGPYAYGSGGASVGWLTPLRGAELSLGWAYGQGEFPSYYGYLETSPYGDVWGELRLPLAQGAALDKERVALGKADQEVLAAEAALRGVRIAVERAAVGAWWRWVASGQRAELAQELLDLARTRDEAVAARVALGDLPELERLDNLRIIAEREARLAEATRALVAAEVELSLYLRDPGGAPVRALAGRRPAQMDPPEPPGAWLDPGLVEQALVARPEFARLDAKLAQVRLEAALARNQRQPTLDLEAGVVQGLGAAGGAVRGPTEVGGGLSFALPAQRREADGALAQAEAALAQLEAERRWLEDRVRAEVVRAQVGLDAAWARWQAAARSAELARALEEAEQLRFDLGDSDLLRLYQREQIYADAALAELDARLAAHLALADLVAATAGGWE